MQANNIFVYSIGMGTAITGANNAVAENPTRGRQRSERCHLQSQFAQGEGMFLQLYGTAAGVPGYRVEDFAAPFEVVERGSNSIVRKQVRLRL